MSGDRIVALLGLMMALMIVSNGGAFRKMAPHQRFIYGAIWAIIIGVGAVIAARLAPPGHP